MKILVVCQHYFPEPYRLADLCESLVKRGHDVTVLTGLPNYPEGRIFDGYRKGERREECLNGVSVIRSFLIPRGSNHLMLFLNYVSFALFASLKALRLKEQFDVLFVHQTSPVLMALPAIAYKLKHRKKMLLYCGDPWPDSLAAGGIKEGALVYKLFWFISKWIYSAADKLMVTSYLFKEYFQDTFGIDKQKIEYLPPYAEDLFILKESTADEEIINMVFAGNIGQAQSVDTIILAANELKDDKKIAFHILGSGSDLDNCRQLVEDLKITNIKFYGRLPIEKMNKYYSMASAMLVSLKDSRSFSCTLPSKVQTYMAAGKPVIGSANGETKRVIEEAECGLCSPAEDYQELAAIIKEFSRSSEKKKMAENSRAYYDRHFSKERFIAGLEKALKELGDNKNV